MTEVIVNKGTLAALKALVNHTPGQNLILRLYKNNKTPAVGDVVGDYTEATFSGYVAQTLTGASWTPTEGNPSVITYPQQTFTSSANQTEQTIYGYYLTQADSGLLIAAERFASSKSITALGATVPVNPRVTGASG